VKTVDVRKELSVLRHLAAELSTLTLKDEAACALACRIYTTTATILQAEEAQNGDLPAVSAQAAGLQVPLDLLDTPANRRLLAALEVAWTAAREVDYERGYGDDGPAQDLEDWVAGTKEEIYGPAGSGRE
jgi:hypothetical protein